MVGDDSDVAVVLYVNLSCINRYRLFLSCEGLNNKQDFWGLTCGRGGGGHPAEKALLPHLLIFTF